MRKSSEHLITFVMISQENVHWIWCKCATHGATRGCIRLPRKVPFFITALLRNFLGSLTHPRIAPCVAHLYQIQDAFSDANCSF